MRFRIYSRHGQPIMEGEAPGISLSQDDADGLTLREVQRLLARGECCIEPVNVKKDEPTPVATLRDRPDRKEPAVAGQKG